MTSSMIKVLLLSFLVISNGADVDLMKKECSYTDYQTTCLKCLESDPNTHLADRVGFPQIIIHCLQSQLHILVTNVTSILSRKKKGEAIKKVLENCNRGFSIAKSTLDEAMDSVIITHNYNKTDVLVKTALSYPLTCRVNLQKLKFKESPQVYDEIGVYAQLSSVVRTMIKRLEHFI